MTRNGPHNSGTLTRSFDSLEQKYLLSKITFGGMAASYQQTLNGLIPKEKFTLPKPLDYCLPTPYNKIEKT